MTHLEVLLKEVSENRSINLENSFNEVAEEIINASRLIAGQSEYQIKEIEFYFSSEYYTHEDPYAHSEQYTVTRQSEFGEWYFHRFKSSSEYTHRRRGLDLTFGNNLLKNFGGILIRSIKSLKENKIIAGPSNVAGEIKTQLDLVNEYAIKSIADATGRKTAFIESPLRITSHKANANRLGKTIRYGLSSKSLDFQNKLYRYVDLSERYDFKNKFIIVKDWLQKEIITPEIAKEILGYNIKQ